MRQLLLLLPTTCFFVSGQPIALAGSAKTTELQIRVNQPEAKIYLDGKEVGITDAKRRPFKIKTSSGNHQVKVTKDGYDTYEKEISTKSKVVRLNVSLDKLGLVREFRGHQSLIHYQNFSPDGKYLVSGGSDKTVILWEVPSGKIVRVFIGHTDLVRSLAFTPDGKKIISGSANGTLRLWNVDTGKEIRRFVGHGKDGLWYFLRVFPSGKQFVSSGLDGTIRIWDLESGKQTRVITHWKHPKLRTCVDAFSRNGRYALIGGPYQQAKLFDLLVNDEIRHLNGFARHAAFSPKDELYAFCDKDGHFFVCDIATGKYVHRLKNAEEANTEGQVRVWFSPNGKYLLTSREKDGFFKVRSLKTGKELDRVETKTVGIPVFSPDGRYAIGRASSDAAALLLYRIPTLR